MVIVFRLRIGCRQRIATVGGKVTHLGLGHRQHLIGLRKHGLRGIAIVKRHLSKMRNRCDVAHSRFMQRLKLGAKHVDQRLHLLRQYARRDKGEFTAPHAGQQAASVEKTLLDLHQKMGNSL